MVYRLNTPCQIVVKSILTFLLCLILVYPARAQDLIDKIEDLTEKVTENMEDTSSKPSFLIYPTIAYTPETSWEFGVSNLFLFYAKNSKKNRLSEINTFTFYTLQQQYGIWLDHAIYGNKDKYIFLGKARFQYFPLKYYGIGENAKEGDEVIVSSQNFQLRERVLKKVKGHLFAGIVFDYHTLYNVRFENTNLADSLKPLGYQGSSNKGLGLGVVYDNRRNVLNERNGLFAEVAYLNYGRYIGSSYPFQNINVDARYFRKGYRKKQVWAFQVIGQFNFGDIPFNQLALLGGESMMRGYYLGRYRDKNLIAAQAEYRFLPFPFSKRWGGALFLATGNVSNKVAEIHIDKFKLAGGMGVRYFIFRTKDIFVRLDLAFTEESAFPGIYFFIGEAF